MQPLTCCVQYRQQRQPRGQTEDFVPMASQAYGRLAGASQTMGIYILHRRRFDQSQTPAWRGVSVREHERPRGSNVVNRRRHHGDAGCRCRRNGIEGRGHRPSQL